MAVKRISVRFTPKKIGKYCTMKNWQENLEREKRAERLVEARKQSNLGGIRKVTKAFGWNENTYKAHEQARASFGLVDARKYAKAYNVSVQWLFMGTGAPGDADLAETPTLASVPLLSWVSAGQLANHDAIEPWDDVKVVHSAGLPEGDWIALRVEGDSMNKISPPDSIIFVNRRDKRLVPNACYVIADETGSATYKRYRPNMEPPFQPASYHDIAPPELSGAIKVIGRVTRSVIDM